MVEITEGLSAGDRVVTAGQNRLFSGSPVTIDNTVNPLPAAAADLAGGSDKAGGDRAGAAGE